jgi:hypothetical protein
VCLSACSDDVGLDAAIVNGGRESECILKRVMVFLVICAV